MPTYVDPQTGEHFDNDAEDADARAAQVGLVPKAQYEADNRPALDTAVDTAKAIGYGALRPLQKLSDVAASALGGEPAMGAQHGIDASSDEARRLAQEHPIASQLPLAAEALLPGGPLVQMAAGTLGSAAESTFEGGGQYGEINPDELLKAAALAGAGAAAAPVIKGAVRGIAKGASAAVDGLYGAGEAAAKKATDLGAGKLGGIAAKARDAGVDYAVNAATGGKLPKFVRDPIAGWIKKAVSGHSAEEVAGTGVQRFQQFEGIEGGLTPEMLGAKAQPPIDPESVAMGTGFGPVFQKAEQSASPAMQRARELIERRQGESGHTILGARERHGLAPQAFTSLRAHDEDVLHTRIANLPQSEQLHGTGRDVSKETREGLTAYADDVWNNDLTPDERSALESYTGPDYQGIRSIQKGETPRHLADVGDDYRQAESGRLGNHAKHLDAAVEKLSIDNPTVHGPLYRGIPATPEMLDEVMRHDDFVTSASTSSSYAPGLAYGFTGTKPSNSLLVKFEHVEKGAPLFGEAGMGESEVLLPRGAKYRITRRQKTPDGDLVVTVRQTGQASKDDMRELGSLGSVSFNAPAGRAGKGPNFSLVDVAKSPIGITTGVAGAIGVGNVLARAERKANESVDFDDLKDLKPDDRQAAIVANGPRYAQQATEQAASALEDKTAAYVAAKDSARKRIGEIAAKPSDAQRAYADVALSAIDSASQSLRGAGDTDAADKLDDVSDHLTETAVAHQQKLPVTHDSGELLSQLDHAYDVLRSRDQLPADAQSALDELKQGTTRPELWGQAGDMLADLRHADDAVDQHNIADTSDPDTWRQNLAEHVAGARHQVDVLDKWGVDTEKLTGKLDKLSDALDRGESVAAELSAAGVRSSDQRADPHDQGPAAQIGSAVSQEFGAPVNLDEALAPSMRQALGDQQKAYRYDTALRSVQRGAEVSLKKAARGMAGLGSASENVEPDASNAAFTSGYSDEQAAFEARRSMIEQLGKNPMALADSMASSYGDLVKTHPEVYDQISSMVTRATDILTQAMPPSMLQSIQHPNGLPPSVDDVRAFSRVYMAVTEPDTFLKDLGAGQAWPEQSQAFAKMYPQQWTRLSQEALNAATERGPRLSPQEATYLDITFNVGNNLGGMWSDKGSQAIRDANTARAKSNQEKAKSLGQPKPAATAPNPATAALSAGPSSTPVS